MRRKTSKILVVAALAVVAALLAGCVHMNVKLTINADGSADYGMEMLMSNSLLAMAEQQGQDVWGEATAQMQKEGFTVEPVEKDDYKGIRAMKRFKDIEELNQANLNQASDMFQADASFTVQQQKGALGTTYTVKSTMDASKTMPSTEGLDETTKLMLEQVKIGMEITLPAKAASHNATAVSADGLTYTWEFKLDKPNTVELTATVPNMLLPGVSVVTALYIGGAALFLIILAVIVVAVNAKKRKAARMQPPVA